MLFCTWRNSLQEPSWAFGCLGAIFCLAMATSQFKCLERRHTVYDTREASNWERTAVVLSVEMDMPARDAQAALMVALGYETKRRDAS